ncbi:MAG: FecR family protein [Xanthomonadales bacterium]|nr:FecR family protein [Xanthomonadales bacterium]
MKSTVSSKQLLAWLVMVVGSFWTLTAIAAPIGVAQIQGEVTIHPADGSAPLKLADTSFAWYAGDGMSTGDSGVVLALNDGSSLGLAEHSAIHVGSSPDGQRIQVRLRSGTVLYTLSTASTSLAIQAGDFSLSTRSPEGLVKVSASVPQAGVVELLEDGHVRIAVRDGHLAVTGSGGTNYQVSAGQQVGLLGGVASTVPTQLGTVISSAVHFESPERVNTGEQFDVSWSKAGQAGQGDFIAIAAAGDAPNRFVRMDRLGPEAKISFEAPDTPGDYEIRYISGETGMVVDSVYLQVVSNVPALLANRWVSGGLLVLGGAGVGWAICDDDCCDDPPPVSP